MSTKRKRLAVGLAIISAPPLALAGLFISRNAFDVAGFLIVGVVCFDALVVGASVIRGN